MSERKRITDMMRTGIFLLILSNHSIEGVKITFINKDISPAKPTDVGMDANGVMQRGIEDISHGLKLKIASTAYPYPICSAVNITKTPSIYSGRVFVVGVPSIRYMIKITRPYTKRNGMIKPRLPIKPVDR